MKTRYWITIIAILLAVCIAASIPLLLPGRDARFAEIISNGKHIRTVDLQTSQTIRIDSPDGGFNVITVKDGKIGVCEATCPDHYCMDRGMCSGGTQIVCLPNKLIIRFQGLQAVDSIVG